jgi:hypothetical protein
MAVFSLLSGIAMAGPASATSSTGPPGKPRLEAIIVEGQRERELERRIQTFARSIVLPSWEESLARWQVPVCPFVAGLTPEQSKFVLTRVSQITRDFGAPLAPEQCEPNFLVVVTPEPAAFLRTWWSRNPKFFNDDRGLGGVEIFVRSTKPIRIWHNVVSKCPDGRTTYEVYGNEGESFIRCVDGLMGSKLRWVTVRKIVSAIVVADPALIEGLTIGQLADYVAMIGLVQIRRNANPGDAPTILNLFANTGPRTQELSRWDQAFLRSLYATDPESGLQLSEIQARMYRDLVR